METLFRGDDAIETARFWNLLPIREAYEWKPCANSMRVWATWLQSCFQFVKRMNGNIFRSMSCIRTILLPIREAYEWKRQLAEGSGANVNPPFLLPIREAYEWKQLLDCVLFSFRLLLASNSWSVWMETFPGDAKRQLQACAQLASNSWSVWMETVRYPPSDLLVHLPNLASNSWSVWMETMCRVNSWINPTIFLIPIS